MTDDHPLKHPENARAFLTYASVGAASALGVVWLTKGAQIAQIPGLVIVVLFMVAMFSWFPIFNRIVGRLPAQSWNEVPSGKRWSEALFFCAFFFGFLIWSVALAAIAFVALDEMGVS
jgi:hypothetical protein